MEQESITERKEISINLGKINTNKVRSLIQDLEFKGKTKTELSSHLNFNTGELEESNTVLTELFGDCDPAITEFLNLVYSSHNYEINETNFKIVMLELTAFRESYIYKVSDKRQTKEELTNQKAVREEAKNKQEEEIKIRDAGIKAEGNLTKGEKINISTTEIAKRIRDQLKKDIPGSKFSVTSEYYSMGSCINIYLMESDIRILRSMGEIDLNAANLGHGYTPEAIKQRQAEKYHQLSACTLREEYKPSSWCNGAFLTEEGHNLLKSVVKIADYYNYNDSDMQSDYYSVNFSMHINIGKYDKPFIQEVA